MPGFENNGFDSSGRVVLRIPVKDAPKYLAAPAMYAALRAYQTANRIHNDAESGLFNMAAKALAVADGKEVSHA